MIRYDITVDDLHALVEQCVPGWLARAEARTATFMERRRYAEQHPIWNEVKSVFMKVQGDGKCGFCERKFESGDLGRHELDIEHFRPKSRIAEWRYPRFLMDAGYSQTPPPDTETGYYLLSYHLLNYAVACKPCNSGLKKSYFPISGRHDTDGEDPRKMGAEKPWLLYPIGRFDVDPGEVITFHGFMPQSKSHDPILKLRGIVTIAFFGLDDVNRRKDLIRQRAERIEHLHLLMRAEEGGDEKAGARVDTMLHNPAEPHANCTRSFVRLFRSDRDRADRVADMAWRFLQSVSP